MAPSQSPTSNLQSKTRWLAFIVVVLIAFFFRFYRLADLPLGTFFDPAYDGLDAVRLMQRGGYVIFFPTNGGRESPFIYLLIPFIGLFGTTPLSLRAPTAIIGLLNVVLLFGFLYDWPSFVPQATKSIGRIKDYRLWLATLGGLVMAVSYWHIVISRLAERPLLIPLLSVPLFWFFLKGWASGQKRWFILAGLCMGLEGYTYSASRLLPVILTIAFLPEFLESVRLNASTTAVVSRKSLLGNSLLFVLVALVVFLPMGWYFLSHPTLFTGRAFSVMVWNFFDTPSEIVAEIGRNVLRVLGFFCCVGSPTPMFGVSNYPGLHPLLVPFLLVGLIGALINWRHLFHRLIALWWLIGLIPSVISIEAPHPLRMIVAVVPTAILVALAPIYLIGWLSGLRFWTPASSKTGVEPLGGYTPAKASTPIERYCALARKARGFDSQWLFWLPIAAALISIPATFRVYFIDWANLQKTGSVYDYKAVAIRDTILATAGEGVPIYLPLACFDDAPLLFYLSDPFKREASLSSPPSDVKHALVIAPEKSQNDTVWVRLQDHTATILPPLTAEGQQLIQAAWAGSSVSTIRTADGEIAAYLASLPADPARFLLRPTRSLAVSFGPARLTGVNYPRTIDTSPGELRIPVTLFWQANARMNDEYEVLVHLVDDSRRSWGNGDARPTDWVYPTTFWRPGRDEIAAQHIVSVEPDTLPPGRYWLALSLYDPATGRRLPITEGESSSPDTFFVGPLKVPMPPPAEPPSTAQSQSARFGDVAQLLGYRVVSQPDGFTLSLYWRAEMPDGADYTVFVHLLNTEGQMVAGQDSQPVSGRYPSSIWEPGEVIADERTFSTDDLPPGEYQLEVGMYQLATGERLSVVLPDGTVEPAQRLVLTTPIQVQ